MLVKHRITKDPNNKKGVGRERLTGLSPVAVPRSVEAAHSQLPRASRSCVSRCVAFLFV